MTNEFSLKEKEIIMLSEAGNSAPSGGNAQPWIVEIGKNYLAVKIDPVRGSSFLDVGHFASLFAIGCFTENICVAAQAIGLKYNVKITFKNMKKPVVIITFTSRTDKVSTKYSQALKLRVTNRQLSNGKLITEKSIKQLHMIIEEFDKKYQLHTVSDYGKKEEVSNILGVADGIRMLNDALFNQMMSEFRFDEEDAKKTKDGLDMATLEMPKNAAKMLNLIKNYPMLRTIIPRKAFERLAKPLLMECSHLCCLSFHGKLDSSAMVRAGILLERIWLDVTLQGTSFQPWSIVPFFLIRLKKFNGEGFSEREKQAVARIDVELNTAFDLHGSTPVFIFRLSYAKPPTARSLRIPWQSYTTIKSR